MFTNMITWLAVMMALWAMPVHAAVAIEQVEAGDLKAWLAPHSQVPVIYVSLTFKDAGAVADPKGKEGLAYIAARMLMQGTTQLDEAAFHAALESHAIDLDIDASQDDLTVGVRTLSQEWQPARDLMMQALLTPLLSPEKFDALKVRMLAKLKQLEESPEYLASVHWQALAYGAHPYANPTLGTRESVEAISLADVQAFLKAHLTRDNLVISVSGDVGASDVKELLTDHLMQLPQSVGDKANIADAVIAPEGRWSEQDATLPQSVVLFGRQGVERNDPDFYAAYMMNYMLGGGSLTSRLAQAVRVKEGLTYGISTDLDVGQHGAAFAGMFATANGQVAQALEIVNKELEKASMGDFTQSQLDAALGYITGSFPLQIASNASLVNYLNVMQLNNLGIDYLEKRNAYFKAVTLEQVNEVAKKLLNPKQMVVVKIGPTSAGQ